MTVRIATTDDVKDLFELNILFENTTTPTQMKESLATNDQEIVCIAFVDGIAAGYCCGLIVKSMCYSDARADIETLFVREEYRKQGIGKALMLCLENALAKRGICHFHISTSSTNTSAQALYRGIGYEPNGEILLDKTIADIRMEELK